MSGRPTAESIDLRRRRVSELAAQGHRPAHIASVLGVSVQTVRDDAREIGVEFGRSKGVYDKVDDHHVKDQLAELKRELGEKFVATNIGDDAESTEVQTYHAALRVIVLEAQDLIPEILAQLARRHAKWRDRLATARRHPDSEPDHGL